MGRAEALEHLEQRLVHHDRPVLGIGDDKAELIRMQAGVERVQHRPHQRDGEVELQVLRLVPQQRGERLFQVKHHRGVVRRLYAIDEVVGGGLGAANLSL